MQPAVYILANKPNGTLYTGVTSDLQRCVLEHKSGEVAGFARRYKCTILVYYELLDEMRIAIEREKQIKAGPRSRKLTLIETAN